MAFRRSAPLSFGSIDVDTPLAFPGMRIGLFGGSFNPPHAAHVQLSEHAIKRLGLHQVWWLVTPGNPIKDQSDLTSLEERLSAASKLVTNPRIVLTALEEKMPSTLSVATVEFLKRRFRGVNFVWLMGADNLASFHRWNGWREMMETVPIAAFIRPGDTLASSYAPAAQRYLGQRLPARNALQLASRTAPAWSLLTMPLSPLSSTAIRTAHRQMKAIGSVNT